MEVTVYLLREHGEKLDREAVRATAMRGVLKFGRHVVVPEHEARLFGPGGNELAMLRCAQVMRIEGGILIRGSITEYDDAGQHHYMQTWWCVPTASVDNDAHIKES